MENIDLEHLRLSLTTIRDSMPLATLIRGPQYPQTLPHGQGGYMLDGKRIAVVAPDRGNIELIVVNNFSPREGGLVMPKPDSHHADWEQNGEIRYTRVKGRETYISLGGRRIVGVTKAEMQAILEQCPNYRAQQERNASASRQGNIIANTRTLERYVIR
jgi:hypothetical protein